MNLNLSVVKSWSIMLAAAFLLFLTSSHSTESAEPIVGKDAPLFSLTNNHGSADIQEMRGKYILLSFWSASDAQSRIDNAIYASAIQDNEKMQLVSVNLDADKTLWQQIIMIDNLDASRQYSSTDVTRGDIIADYHLKTGNRAYLINPEGKIEAVNPSVNQLVKLN